MAGMFKDAFKENLIFQPPKGLEANTEYPSPSQLLNKIIVKHKKLDKGSTEVSIDVSRSADDVSSSLHNGFLYVEDPFDHKWQKVCISTRETSTYLPLTHIQLAALLCPEPLQTYVHGARGRKD